MSQIIVFMQIAYDIVIKTCSSQNLLVHLYIVDSQ